MMGISDREEVLNYVKSFMQEFREERLQVDFKDRRRRVAHFQEALKRESIRRMDEFSLVELLSQLWAFRMFANKEWKIRKIISDNGLDSIKSKLENLLYGNEPFPTRFDRFVDSKSGIKGLGIASTTEILCYFNPSRWGIWNRKVRDALKILKLDDRAPVNKYILSGEEYEEVNSLLGEIAEVLQGAGFRNADLLTVDLFLFWITEFSKRSELPPWEEVDFDHDEIRDMIKDIGEWLGFSAETEFQLERGTRIDVIWEARIANLGLIKYAFEIHKRGSIDSLILNLQKASSKPDIQRVIAVSTSKELDRIEEEVKNLPDSFKRKLLRWNVVDVKKMYENLMEVIEGLRDLGLIPKE